MNPNVKVPELVPVIDLMGGIVVRGVGGRRSEYRPIQSRLTASIDPVEVGRALVDAFHPKHLYIADLDAIAGASPAWVVYRDLRGLGVELWVDAGVHSPEEATALAEAGIDSVICGLETLPGPAMLAKIVDRIGAARAIFSLDLKGAKLLNPAWEEPSPPTPYPKREGGNKLSRTHFGEGFFAASRAVDLGISRLIVLDLARVGEGAGTGTEDLCAAIASTYPHVNICAGGGIRGRDDVQRLGECGVSNVLVASALHDGRIKPR